MTTDEVLALITEELTKAEAKHPVWPENRLRQVAIIVEEAGEVLQAALNIIETEEALVKRELAGYDVTLAYNGMARLEEQLQKEVAQTGAMAVRWLINRHPLYANAENRPK